MVQDKRLVLYIFAEIIVNLQCFAKYKRNNSNLELEPLEPQEELKINFQERMKGYGIE